MNDQVRYVDFPTQLPATQGFFQSLPIALQPNERIVNVETITDSFGYATFRVWITMS